MTSLSGRAEPRPTKRGSPKPTGCGVPDAGPAGPREGILASGKKRMQLDLMFLFGRISYWRGVLDGIADGRAYLWIQPTLCIMCTAAMNFLASWKRIPRSRVCWQAGWRFSKSSRRETGIRFWEIAPDGKIGGRFARM